MAKVCKNNHPAEQVLQRIEALLIEEDVSLDFTPPLMLTVSGRRYRVVDVEQDEDTAQLPRQVDSERLRVMED
jgi:signal recognition particle GTPase